MKEKREERGKREVVERFSNSFGITLTYFFIYLWI
jgi:hypothetical protein